MHGGRPSVDIGEIPHVYGYYVCLGLSDRERGPRHRWHGFAVTFLRRA